MEATIAFIMEGLQTSNRLTAVQNLGIDIYGPTPPNTQKNMNVSNHNLKSKKEYVKNMLCKKKKNMFIQFRLFRLLI